MRQLAIEGHTYLSRAVIYRAAGRQQERADGTRAHTGIYTAVIGLLLLLAWGLLSQVGAYAQEFRATISGTVVDPTGALVPGASVVVLETNTGSINRTTSNGVGEYVVPFLPPGDYSITVTKKGFETLVRAGVKLQAQQHPIINLVLTVGRESQSVSVTAEAPLEDRENASIGDVIDTQSVADLPLNGRVPAMLAELSVGVMLAGAPTQLQPSGNANAWVIGGTPPSFSESLLDGAPNLAVPVSTGSASTFSPTEDTVTEVSVRTFDTDASEGHSIAGVINQVTKSGTNTLHGTAYEFTQFPEINANLYFNDRSVPVVPTPTYHYNQFGLTAGGPVLVPKIFNGKNKLFFFFAWEGLKTTSPATTITTVPTDAEKEGDFSALLAGGSGYQLYEPNTGTLVAGAFKRTPVPNNCLTNKSSYCSGVANAGITIDPIALAYLKLYPEPNYTTGVSSITNQDNYNSNAPGTDKYNSEFGRLDYNTSARNHLFFDYRHSFNAQGKNNYFGNNTTGALETRTNWGTVLDDVFTLNPTTAFDVRLNWMNYNSINGVYPAAYKPTDVGFPSYMNTESTYLELPEVSFSSGYTTLSNTGAEQTPSTSYQVFGEMMKSLGRHALKVGFDGRQYRERIQVFGDSSGLFSFSTSFVTSGTGGSAQPFGGDLAAFEYGLPTSGAYQLEALGDYRSYYVGAFFQDDWRVNKHLTLNLGLRYDIGTPWGEKFGRTVSGFNPTAVNSASAAAGTAFKPTTVTVNDTAVTINSINTLGGLTFPSSDWGAPYQIADKAGFWSPRIGFSYNPGFAPLAKTLIRGGFAIFSQPQSIGGESTQEGFSASTSYAATTNNYFTSAGTLDNPFPNGFVLPAGSSQGTGTFLGSPSTVTFFDPVEHDMYSERWNLGVQQLLARNTLLEVIYEGNHAVHIPVNSSNINSIDPQFLTTNPYRDQNLATALSTAVANPFAGLLPNGTSSYNGATTALSNLLVPYPAFGGAAITEYYLTIGQSFFNSGMVHVEQRAKYGLTLTANYTFAKLIEQDSQLHAEYPYLLERRVSPNDHKQHFALGTVYELPFGRGKLFSFGGSKLGDEIAGGWVVNGIYQFQTGPPITFSADIPFQPGMGVSNIKSSPRNLSATGTGTPALTNASSVFVTGSGTSCTVSSSQPCDGTVFFNGQYADHFRTMPTTIGSVREDGFNNLDASVLKNFKFTEKSYLQLRFETFNTLNHPVFGSPNVSSATASNFGYITSVYASSEPRQVQAGARIVF